MVAKTRNQYIDILRGLTIILVVFGHAIQGVNHGDSTNPIHLVIQSFQMALLMIISGFVMGFSKIEGNYRQAVEKRIRRLLIPYIIWEQLQYFLHLARTGGTYSIYEHLGGILWSDFWFLRVLFVLCLLYIIFVFISSKLSPGGGTRPLILAGVFVLVYGLSLIPGLENLRLYSIYFALGNLVYKAKKRGALSHKLEYVLAIISGFAFVLCVVLYFANTPPMVKWVVFKIMGVTGSITFATIALLCVKFGKITTFLNWIGKKTLPIYAIHWCLLFSMDIPELWKLELPFYLSVAFGCTLWLLICIILIVLIQKSKMASMLFLGE